MAPSLGEVNTFVSRMRGEALPDLTVAVGDYAWEVHGLRISEQSGFFLNAQQTILKERTKAKLTLCDVDPLLIGHFILWLYVEEYDELVLPAVSQLSLQLIMRRGARLTNEDDDDDDTLPTDPILDAKMYPLGDKYEVPKLKSQAEKHVVDGLKPDHLGQDDEVVALLQYLLAPAAEALPASEDEPKFRPHRAVTRAADPIIWETLASKVVADIGKLRGDSKFQTVMIANPTFLWDVMNCMAPVVQSTQIAQKNATKKATPKSRKRKSTQMSTPADDNTKTE